MQKSKGTLYILPRVLGVLLVILVTVLAFDVFAEDGNWWQLTAGFLIHLIPTAIILIVLWVACYYELVGGGMFVGLGLSYMIMAGRGGNWLAALILAGPFLLTGFLFIIYKVKEVKVEFMDVVDSAGKLTGEKKTKKTLHSQGLWHRSSHIWIFNSKGEILLQKRAKDKDTHPGEWDISAAGHVALGEDYDVTALRELKEELGLAVKLEDLIKTRIFKHKSESPEKKYYNKEISQEYLCKYDGSITDFKFIDGEVEKIKFVSQDKFKKMLNDPKEYAKLVDHGQEYYLQVLDFVKKAFS
ncbi:NUDIX domain-containing protein [Candidatus Falkowbacteria bacterium]|jgi:isopentenyl-diphosphate Delta-isomerase|nr:NUDIX domain-containing protein [Candidatus Falkowbacteria bacterium]MBT5503276.1 NUDIX domain-containing protein [Candidatus Falkowbacteria bacterium]MBT6574275.1 NUDIX domain-containing protein [Candidatus Falkowbacteria bacterium]MBT7348179.1 NUDIX domain-containing protein [Candidatus Falkowbacteria bacterium]MBT7500584.1 NUDIX domain-containing protein [Candidatus Falkowbacteria bacterium]